MSAQQLRAYTVITVHEWVAHSYKFQPQGICLWPLQEPTIHANTYL